MTTHITEKGALMTAIKAVREDMTSGFDEDELEDYRPGMPHHPEEDLMCYSSKQLERKFSDWLEYLHDMREHMNYVWYETEVRA